MRTYKHAHKLQWYIFQLYILGPSQYCVMNDIHSFIEILNSEAL